MGRRHLSCNEPRAPQPRCTGCVLTDEAGTWRGALQWRGTMRYYYRCARVAVGANITSLLLTNTAVSYKLYYSVLDRSNSTVTIETRGRFSKFVAGENLARMIPDRSGDFDDHSIDCDPVWPRRGAQRRTYDIARKQSKITVFRNFYN